MKLEITHVNITPIVRRRKYQAAFNIINGIVPNVEITIGGDTPEICLQKTEKFIEFKLTKDQYTIHK